MVYINIEHVDALAQSREVRRLFEMTELDLVGHGSSLSVGIAKSNIVVRDVALAEQEGTTLYERCETVRRGQGREAYTEEWVSRVRVVSDLRQWEHYRPPVEEGQRLTWEQRPGLTAVIVNLWRNQAPHPDGDRVYLTNAPATDP